VEDHEASSRSRHAAQAPETAPPSVSCRGVNNRMDGTVRQAET